MRAIAFFSPLRFTCFILHIKTQDRNAHKTERTAAVRCVCVCDAEIEGCSRTSAQAAKHRRSMSNRPTPLCSEETNHRTLPTKSLTDNKGRDNSHLQKTSLCSDDHRGTVLLLFCHRLIKELLNSEMDLAEAKASGLF